MAEAAYYYGGVRLKDAAHGWRPRTDRTGEHRQQGVTAAWGTMNTDSPNYFVGLEVVTDVRPVTLRSDLDARTCIAIDLAALESTLRTMAKGATYPVSWVRTTARRASVSGGPYSGTTDVTLGAWDDGFVPTAGRYLLVRNAATGAGFVTPIISIPGAGQVRLALSATVTSAWEVLEVQVYYPDMLWVGMDAGTWPNDDPASDSFRPMVTYAFEGVSSAVYASAHAPTPE